MYHLPKDPERPQPFDPRKHSSVLLNINEKLPSTATIGIASLTKSAEFPLRSLVVGPHVKGIPAGGSSRPSSAPATSKRATDPAAPRFLDRDGRWVPSELPGPVLATQHQPLTATGTITAKVAHTFIPTQKGAVRPVSAVHSYNDISPVVTAEHVRDPHRPATAAGSGHSHRGRSGSRPSSAVSSPRPHSQSGPRTPQQVAPGQHMFQAHDGRYVPEEQAYGDDHRGHEAHYGNGHPAAPQQHHNAQYLTTQTQNPSKAPKVGVSPYLQPHPGSAADRRRASSARPATRYAHGTSGKAITATAGGVTTQPGKSPSPYLNSMHAATTRPASARPVSTGRPRHMPAATQSLHQTMGVYSTMGDRATQVETVLRPGELGEPLPHPLYDGAEASLYAHDPQYAGTTQPAGAYGRGSVQGNASGATVSTVQYGADGKLLHVNASGPFASAASNAFWPKPGPPATNLTREDLIRSEELGKGVTAGTANCRLIGGKWKYVPRPVEGDVVYTDYYGRYGPEHANYYGRSYHLDTAEFAKHRLVNDSAYQRVRASMMGIQNLRDRPGLSMDASIVHGPPETLNHLDNHNATTNLANLHRMNQYANLKPERTAWVA